MAIPEDQMELLRAIEATESNSILVVKTSGGLVIQAGEEGEFDTTTPRGEARWAHALDDLVKRRLLTRTRDSYSLTHEAYQLLDTCSQ